MRGVGVALDAGAAGRRHRQQRGRRQRPLGPRARAPVPSTRASSPFPPHNAARARWALRPSRHDRSGRGLSPFSGWVGGWGGEVGGLQTALGLSRPTSSPSFPSLPGWGGVGRVGGGAEHVSGAAGGWAAGGAGGSPALALAAPPSSPHPPRLFSLVPPFVGPPAAPPDSSPHLLRPDPPHSLPSRCPLRTTSLSSPLSLSPPLPPFPILAWARQEWAETFTPRVVAPPADWGLPVGAGAGGAGEHEGRPLLVGLGDRPPLGIAAGAPAQPSGRALFPDGDGRP